MCGVHGAQELGQVAGGMFWLHAFANRNFYPLSLLTQSWLLPNASV